MSTGEDQVDLLGDSTPQFLSAPGSRVASSYSQDTKVGEAGLGQIQNVASLLQEFLVLEKENRKRHEQLIQDLLAAEKKREEEHEELIHTIREAEAKLEERYKLQKEDDDVKDKADAVAKERELANTTKAGFGVFAIFLASVIATLLAVDRMSTTKRRIDADNAISTCWLIGLMLALLSSSASLPINYAQIGDLLKPTPLSTLASLTMLMLGASIWVWNEYPSSVSITSTVVGISLWLVLLLISVISGAKQVAKSRKKDVVTEQEEVKRPNYVPPPSHLGIKENLV